MKRKSATQWLLFVGVLPIMILMSVLKTTTLQAQEAPSIRVPAGQTLEIATDNISHHTEYSWILTKDRKFQSAQRNRFFQNRFAETGIYSLDVSIHDADTGENSYRSFSIVVTEPVPATLPDDVSTIPSTARSAVIVSEPLAMNGVVYLPPSGGMLKLHGSESTGKISSYAFDVDTSVDTNGDGDPENDTDNEGTLSEKIGSPLYLFVVPSNHPRSIRLTVSDLSDQTAASALLNVSFSGNPQAGSTSSGLISMDPNSPITYRVDGMSIQTDARFDPSTVTGKSLLLEWDFGDRSKSLLNNPTHTYNFPGSYTVSLIARDITTGDVVYEGSTGVQILPSQNPTSSTSSSSQESVQSSVSTGGSSSSGIGSIITVVVIIFFLLMIAGGLYAVLTWIKKRTTYSIQKTLEKVEESIVRKDAKEEVLASSAPMSMKKSEDKIIDVEKSKTDFTTRERTQITPTTSAGPVPSWLQQAPKAPSSVKPTPPPAPKFTPPVKPIITERKPLADLPVTQKDDAATAPPVASPKATEQGPVPDWLKPTKPSSPPPPPAPKMPSPAPAPTPVVTKTEPVQEKEVQKVVETVVPSAEKEPQKVVEPAPSPVVEKIEPIKQPDAAKVPDVVTPVVEEKVTQKMPEPAPLPVDKDIEPTVTESVPSPVVAKEVQKVPDETAAPLVPKDIPLATPAPVIPKDIPRAEANKKDDEPPIAIIQADSLMK